MAHDNSEYPTLRSFTIKTFCARNELSLRTYHDLHKKGLGPKRIELGRFIRITREAEREWLAMMEEGTTASRSTREPERPNRERPRARSRR